MCHSWGRTLLEEDVSKTSKLELGGEEEACYVQPEESAASSAGTQTKLIKSHCKDDARTVKEIAHCFEANELTDSKSHPATHSLATTHSTRAHAFARPCMMVVLRTTRVVHSA